MGSEQNRFPQQDRRKKWGGCLGGLPCFGGGGGGGRGGGGKRIVPASRTPDGATAPNQPSQPNQPPSLAPHLLAPPSSPASFSNSALPSTAPSPRCHLSSMSSSSPGGPSSTMYATGPYAHETQLVTPPVFSTFTTEPSTAPLTPPPELAHLTTPSSPDVPFAHFLSSSADLSPSPWDASQASNFFCPATFAQFYLDQPHSGGRLSISKESDVIHPVNQTKQNKTTKQEVEEIEAYRASFGFSADEMISTPQYVEISDVTDDSFTIMPCTSNKPQVEEATFLDWRSGGSSKSGNNSPGEKFATSGSDINAKARQGTVSSKHSGDGKSDEHPGKVSGRSTLSNHALSDEEDIFSNMGKFKNSRKLNMGLSCSDAEIEYRRGRSLRECRGDLTWH